MAWSLKIFRFAGINVYLHWTFLLLLIWIVVASLSSGQPTAEALESTARIAVLTMVTAFGYPEPPGFP